jgi:hypothetical protein
MLEGRYFFPHSARFVPARAAIAGGKTLRIENLDGSVLAEVPLRKVRVAARLGRIARRFDLPDGARFETDDNDGADEMLRAARRLPGWGWVDRLERSWRTVFLSVLLAALAAYGFVLYGIPAIAAELALHNTALKGSTPRRACSAPNARRKASAASPISSTGPTSGGLHDAHRGDKAEYPVLLSNGNLIESGDLPGGGISRCGTIRSPSPAICSRWWPAISACSKTASSPCRAQGRARIYVEHGNEPRAAYAMDSLKRAMKWDEEKYGREYDLDIFMIVAVSAFNMGAMENKGLNIFNDKVLLASPETATDDDYARIESVVAHEYFHNWTGDRITCRDWFQLSLKEGLTVFRDQSFPPTCARRRQAHRGRARAARTPVPGGCRAARPSGAAAELHHHRQFLHRDGLREGRRSHRHAEDAGRRRRLSQGDRSLFRAP